VVGCSLSGKPFDGSWTPFSPRSAQLEKEVATLREKIHHLDDMLKSQQRKVRQMIEQVRGAGLGWEDGEGRAWEDSEQA